MFSAAQALKGCQCKAEGAALGGPKRKSDNAAVASWSGLPCGADVERRTALSNCAGRECPAARSFSRIASPQYPPP